MKLWMVLLFSGQIGGTWGPLPYDMGECLERAREQTQIIQEAIRKNSDKVQELLPAEEVELVCLAQDERPVITEK